MTDIVERLRKLASVDNCQASLEAADEITRLRAALERMLLEFDFMVEGGVIPDVRNDIIFVEARAALQQEVK